MAENKEIIVNGRHFTWQPSIITKSEVGKLAYSDSNWYKELVKKNPFKIMPYLLSMSATYKNAHPDNGGKESGIMESMEAVRVQNGTVFNIHDTSNA